MEISAYATRMVQKKHLHCYREEAISDADSVFTGTGRYMQCASHEYFYEIGFP